MTLAGEMSSVCALRVGGAIVVQMGLAPRTLGGVQGEGGWIQREKVRLLERWGDRLLGYQDQDQNRKSQEGGPGSRLFVYNVYIPSFVGEWAFAVLFTLPEDSTRFKANAAKVDLAVRQRIVPSALPLKYVDGTVMEVYSKLPREWQDVYCRQGEGTIVPEMCRRITLPSLPFAEGEGGGAQKASEKFVSLRQRGSDTTCGHTSEDDWWQLVAAADVPRLSNLGLHDAATALQLPPGDFTAIERFVEATQSKEYGDLLHWLRRFGNRCEVGGEWYASSASLMTFMNHSCEPLHKSVIGSKNQTSLRAKNHHGHDGHYGHRHGSGSLPGQALQGVTGSDKFSLIAQRHERHLCLEKTVVRDIKRGEAL